MTSLSQARAARPGATSFFAATFGAIILRFSRQRTLKRLDELDDRLLRDIGLTRGDITEMRRHW